MILYFIFNSLNYLIRLFNFQNNSFVIKFYFSFQVQFQYSNLKFKFKTQSKSFTLCAHMLSVICKFKFFFLVIFLFFLFILFYFSLFKFYSMINSYSFVYLFHFIQNSTIKIDSFHIFVHL